MAEAREARIEFGRQAKAIVDRLRDRREQIHGLDPRPFHRVRNPRLTASRNG
jgi:hypothetical protein